MKNAIEDGWIKKIVRTRLFNLLTLIKIGNPRLSHIAIYIEGDGDAWIDEDTISLSPTPKVPVTLSLAFSDPLPNILYISRPCQFVKKLNLRNCNPKYWSHHRYSPEVVAAIVEAINIIKKENNINSIELIGYSGGGTMAALISSGRFGFDVKRLITVAGNLDTHEWTKYLNVSPLWGSLNPAT